MQKLFSLPIRLQLFIIVFIMTIFSFGIIVYSGIHLRDAAIKDAIKDANILADMVASENVKIVADMQQLMTALAQLPEVRSLRVEKLQPVLRNVLSTNPKYSNIFVADRRGRVVASAVPTGISAVSDRRYFKNTLSTDGFSAGEYIVSRFTGKPVMPFSYPLKDSHGDAIGIIAMGIDITYYKALLDTLRLPAGSSFLLLDHKGIIMTRGLNPSDFIGEQYDPVGFNKMADGPEQDTFVAVAHDGIKRFISYRKLRLEGDKLPYMYVRAGIPFDSTLAQANKMLTRNLVLLTVSLCLVVLLVLFIGKRSIVDRISLLERASKSLADGDPQVKVSDLIVGGELGRLSLTFDRMTGEIANREAALRESELRYHTLFDQSPDGIVIVDPNGRIVEFNDAACRQLDYSREEFSGMSIADIDPDGSPDDNRRRTENILKDGRAEFDVRHLTRLGEIRHTHVITKVVVLTGDVFLYAIWRDISERRRAELEVAERGVMLQQIMDTASVGIGIIDNAGRFSLANRCIAGMFGCAAAELIGSEYVEHVHPSEREAGRRSMLRLLTGEITSVELDRQYLKKDGTIFWGHLTCNRFYDARGNNLGIIGAITDITERKRFEKKLQDSELRLHTILNNVGASIFLKDTQYRYVYANQLVCDLFGVRPEEIVGKKDSDFFSPGSVEEIMRSDRPVIERGETIRREERGLAAADGQPRSYWTVKLPLWDAQGTVVGLCGISTDISERKRAEEELREKEEKYRLLFESANDGIFIQDETGFTDCNEKGAEMYGLTRGEMVGRSLGELAPKRQPHGRISSEVAGEKIRAALDGAPQVFEWQPLRADGGAFDVEITLSRIELGGKMYLQTIVRDIRERKKLAQEILKTQKLESLGTLAGGLAHDFNNLLQGVFGYISMAKLTFDERDKALAMLEQAESALHQSVNITTQLLTFSRGGKPVKKAITLGALIKDSVQFALSGSQVGCKLDIASDLWPVEADAGQVGQVVQNVVLNADQAMPEGGTIVIAAKNLRGPKKVQSQTLGEGIYVEISIRDTGIGIPAKHLQKIFDPYFTTKEKGSGLGLATSYAIVRNHGGLIDVESELGKGTAFTIYLPATTAVEEAIPEREVPSSSDKLRVLVMDDEDLLLDVAGGMLKALGHYVETAKQGEAAIEKYRTAMDSGKPYDIVILDLTIRGGIGGRETIKKLLQIDSRVKAIVSSGYSNDQVLSEYQKYGFKACLAKPYKIEDLRNALIALLG